MRAYLRLSRLVKSSNWHFVVIGFLLGCTINIVASRPDLVTSSLSMTILAIFQIASIVVLLFLIWNNWKTAKKSERNKQLRLLFLGLSLISFLFAFSDFATYWLGTDPHITVTNNPPILWFGGVPITSVLSSSLLGAMFGLIERFIEVIGKKGI